MAAALVGTLTAFDSDTQTWEEYVEILDYFFIANRIEDADRKRAILLSSVGSRTYSLMRMLLSPGKPGDKSYDELTALLQSHYNPKSSEIVERFKFNSRTRAANETVMEYVAALRKLAQHCNYGDALKEMLRDRLVCGVADDRIQRRLLAEPGLTLEKALEVAQATETANRDVRNLQLLSKTQDGTSYQWYVQGDPAAEVIYSPASPQQQQLLRERLVAGVLQSEHHASGRSRAAAADAAAAAAAHPADTSTSTKSNVEDQERPYIKKPPNAFVIFMNENRKQVMADMKLPNSAAANKVLGNMWSNLMTKEEKEVYFRRAEIAQRQHSEQNPGWSTLENYGKKRKRVRSRTATFVTEPEEKETCVAHVKQES